MIFPVGQAIPQATKKTFNSLSVVKCGNPTMCFANIHSATISYLLKGHINVTAKPCKKGTIFLRECTFSYHFKS